MDERARRGGTVGMKCGRVVDKTPLPELGLPDKRLNPRGKVPHVTEVMEQFSLDPLPGPFLSLSAPRTPTATALSGPALALAAISGDNDRLRIFE